MNDAEAPAAVPPEGDGEEPGPSVNPPEPVESQSARFSAEIASLRTELAKTNEEKRELESKLKEAAQLLYEQQCELDANRARRHGQEGDNSGRRECDPDNATDLKELKVILSLERSQKQEVENKHQTLKDSLKQWNEQLINFANELKECLVEDYEKEGSGPSFIEMFEQSTKSMKDKLDQKVEEIAQLKATAKETTQKVENLLELITTAPQFKKGMAPALKASPQFKIPIGPAPKAQSKRKLVQKKVPVQPAKVGETGKATGASPKPPGQVKEKKEAGKCVKTPPNPAKNKIPPPIITLDDDDDDEHEAAGIEDGKQENVAIEDGKKENVAIEDGKKENVAIEDGKKENVAIEDGKKENVAIEDDKKENGKNENYEDEDVDIEGIEDTDTDKSEEYISPPVSPQPIPLHFEGNETEMPDVEMPVLKPVCAAAAVASLIENPIKKKRSHRKQAKKENVSHGYATETKKPRLFYCRCNKKYTSLDKLNRHLYYTERKRNFGCTYCESRFAYQCLLNVHLKSRHSVAPVKAQTAKVSQRRRSSVVIAQKIAKPRKEVAVEIGKAKKKKTGRRGRKAKKSGLATSIPHNGKNSPHHQVSYGNSDKYSCSCGFKCAQKQTLVTHITNMTK